MSREIFTFKKQLDVGAKGEDFFLDCYGNKASKSDGRKFDLFFDGKSVELKTDTYPIEKTPNFFMEKLGNVESNKIGGPWRAADDGVDYFVYLFASNKTFYWFETKKLVKFLDEYTKGKRGRTVANRGYVTLGFLVPRLECKAVTLRRDVFNEK